MLRELRIHNFAIIDSATVSFGTGLNVITGETGAGKSIILDAVGIALGDRASRDLIGRRGGAATIELVLDRGNETAVEELGLDGEDELIIRRQVSEEGPSRIFICGMRSTVGNLRTVLDGIVDVHGQFEHQALLDEDHQRLLLDRAGGHAAVVEDVAEAYRAWRSAVKEDREFRARLRDRQQRHDLLLFQHREIADAVLKEGEDEELEARRRKLVNAERLASAAAEGYDGIRDEDRGALDALFRVRSALEKIAGIDDAAKEALQTIEGCIAGAEDVADFFRDYGGGLAFEPAELDRVMARIDLIDRLKTKYGGSLAGVIEHGERVARDLEALEDPAGQEKQLEKAVREAEARYRECAERLRSLRVRSGKRFSAEIEKSLRNLAIPGGRFSVEVAEAEPGPHGRDRIRFLFSANPGEKIKPLAQVASGGELSRVMLAIKGVLDDTTPVLVFDEIDAGIGGRAAHAVGEELRRLAERHQVICVTHQPAVAARGDHHFRVVKQHGAGGTTTVAVEAVSSAERVDEVARMLSGTPTAVSRRHARELLSTAGRPVGAGEDAE